MAKRNFVEMATKLSDVVGGNIYLRSISKGVMPNLPIIIIGSFASLFVGLPIPFWQSFIQSAGLVTILNMVVAATTNMLGVYFTYGIAKAYAKNLELQADLVPILAIVAYLTLSPLADPEASSANFAYTYLGTKGMIVGIFVAIFTVKIFKAIVDAKIVIKMPEGTPDYVSNSFVSLIPGFVVIIVAMVVRALFGLTPWGNIFDCLYNLLQIPLTAIMGNNVIAMCIFQLITQLLWVFGVHPGFLASLTGPIMFGLDGMNQAAYAAGEPIPSVIGMAFSYAMTVAVVYPAFAVAVALFSKSSQLKTVGKISVAPAFLGISEPLIFGVPVVLNPFVAVPWIITPMLNFVLGYLACSSGLVAKYAGVTVFNFPMVATGLLNGSVSLAIMEVVLFVLDVLVYMPFIRMQDKKVSCGRGGSRRGRARIKSHLLSFISAAMRATPCAACMAPFLPF